MSAELSAKLDTCANGWPPLFYANRFQQQKDITIKREKTEGNQDIRKKKEKIISNDVTFDAKSCTYIQ
jgi:predicted lipoprotein with Yx(FWY)xxD motif